MVPRRGLEPPPGFPDMDLNHARLPIPPPRLGGVPGGLASGGGAIYSDTRGLSTLQ
jgi:hypothetical protein